MCDRTSRRAERASSSLLALLEPVKFALPPPRTALVQALRSACSCFAEKAGKVLANQAR
jgi:hypothetical protein